MDDKNRRKMRSYIVNPFKRVGGNPFKCVNEPYEEEYGVNPSLKKTEQRHEWIVFIKEMVEDAKRPSKLSIYRVHDKLVKLKEDAYAPSIVSIGPLHRPNKELLPFEERKRQCMAHLLARTLGDEDTTLKKCADAILNLVEEARRCYSENIDLEKHKLATILLVDGCFIIELFLQHSPDIQNQEGEEKNDIIINTRNVATFQHDLALLENQIPFFVLQTLFNLIKESVRLPHELTKYALLFFRSALGFSEEAVESKASNLTGDHLLHILHNFYIPETFHKGHKDDFQGLQRCGFTDCATQLLKAGIQLQGNTDAITEENFLAIEFHDGVVKMSSLQIHEATESIFRNLIAFECNINGSSHCITSYAFLMRSLLCSSHDVELLKEKEIIKDLNGGGCGDGGGGGGGGGEGEDLVVFFKSLCEGVVLTDFCFSSLCEEVNEYYSTRTSWLHWRRHFLILEGNWRRLKAITKDKWRESMSDLHKKYFSDLWATISIIAAASLLIFTGIQTYYAVISYYHHHP